MSRPSSGCGCNHRGDVRRSQSRQFMPAADEWTRGPPRHCRGTAFFAVPLHLQGSARASPVGRTEPSSEDPGEVASERFSVSPLRQQALFASSANRVGPLGVQFAVVHTALPSVGAGDGPALSVPLLESHKEPPPARVILARLPHLGIDEVAPSIGHWWIP